jgi:hypothetical protein
MYFRSTGLGKTQLTGRIVEMQLQGDYLIAQIDITEPVKWRMRVAMSFRELAGLVGACMKASILKLLLSPKQWFDKKPKHPGDF